MIPYIALAVGILMLAACVAYRGWVHFRVWVLKQDLFEIRDRLWDQAHRGGFLNDPGYCDARGTLNSLIRFSPRLCLPVWEHARRCASSRDPAPEDGCRPEVERAIHEMSARVVRYVYYQTGTGILWRLARSMGGSRPQAQASADDAAAMRISRKISMINEMDESAARSPIFAAAR